MDKFPLTKTGFAMLEQELKRRKGTDRPSVLPKRWNFWIRIRMWEWLVLGMNDFLAQKLKRGI